MSCFVQYAPYKLKEGTWDEKREAFGDTVINTIAEYAPNLKNIIVGRQVVTPLDLEREWGLTEGNIFQGELSLEQLFFLRPVPGWAQYKTPIKNLWMCGSATHPGGGIMGAPGRLAALGDPEALQEATSMSATRDIVIIGAGHNGLVTAFYLAKAGFKPLVLERRDTVGGCATTEEFHPGFKCSRLSHAAWPVHPSVLDDMDLVRHGLKTYTPDVRVLSLAADGKHLALYGDPKQSQREIAQFSTKDAEGYAEFRKALAAIGSAIEYLLTMTPPDLDDPASGNLWELVQAGRKLRGLGEKDLYRLLRWGPMAVADLVSEFFENDLLRGYDRRAGDLRHVSRAMVGRLKHQSHLPRGS